MMTTVSETIRDLDPQFPPDIPLQTGCFRGSRLTLVVQYQEGSDVSSFSPFTKECFMADLSKLGGILFHGFPITSLCWGMERLPRNVYNGDGSPIDDAVGKKIGGIYECMAVRFAWQAGDLLLLDNMLVAHARDPYKGPRKIVVAMGDMVYQEARQMIDV